MAFAFPDKIIGRFVWNAYAIETLGLKNENVTSICVKSRVKHYERQTHGRGRDVCHRWKCVSESSKSQNIWLNAYSYVSHTADSVGYLNGIAYLIVFL